MNRGELKGKAKELVRGNKWYIWKPLIFYGLITFGIALICGILDSALGLTTEKIVEIGDISYTYTQGGIFTIIAEIILSIIGFAFSIGYAKYVLSFVRGTKMEFKDLVNFGKDNLVIAILSGLLVGIIVFVGTLLLIIPGIIAALGLCYYKEVCADNPELGAKEIVKKSWELTKGFKLDLFVLGLSFIGWCILAGLTLGILYIWLIPYMIVTLTVAYEYLRTR